MWPRPQADGYFPVLLNSSVHVVMYGHYFATGLGACKSARSPPPRCCSHASHWHPAPLRAGLPSPFNMYISSIQMTQFVAIIIVPLFLFHLLGVMLQ